MPTKRVSKAVFGIFLAGLVVTGHMRAGATSPAQPGELISVQRGSLPIIFSAPHDGAAPVPGGEEKTRGTTVRDMHTAEVTRLVAELLAERLEAKPYFVIAEFSRRHVDANRGPGLRPDEAYACELSKVHYEAYHRTLREFVDEVREKSGSGLLIDIHGQSTRPGHIIRGTVNGETVSAMLAAHGLNALIGPASIFGQLDQRGYAVEPPVREAPDSPADETLFIGGYIVRAYGSQNSNGIDAIQVELGRDYRQANVRRQLAKDLAEAIAIYAEAYLLSAEVASD
jgi:N-formylglutamate amidohydrolase